MEIEQLLLGEIFLEPKIFDEVSVIINVDVFTQDKYKAIYKAMCTLNENGQPIDTLTIYQELRKMDVLNSIVKPEDITNCSTHSSANFQKHAIILLEEWMKKQLVFMCENAKERIADGADVFEIIGSVNQAVYEIENNAVLDADRDIANERERLMQNVKDRLTGNLPAGLMCNSFPSFNKATAGIMDEDVVVVYGEEKSAKTTFSDRLLLDFALDEKPISVYKFNLEMSFDKEALKMLSMEGGVKYIKLRNPRGTGLTDAEFQDFIKRTAKFDKTKIYLDDRTYDFEKMLGKMKIAKRKLGIGLFAIDYIGLIESMKKFEARRLEIGHYSRRLKNTAKALKTPIIIVSQANENMKTAEAVNLLRDCDIAFHCCKPADKDGMSKEIYVDGWGAYQFKDDDFLITCHRNRDNENKQQFVCGYIGTDFKEKSYYDMFERGGK